MINFFRTQKLSKITKFHFAIVDFKLPDLGEKIKEAAVKKWLVQEGDEVEEFQEIADVSTDKLFTQLYSPEKGKIHKLMIEEDDFCQVGQVICQIDTGSDKTSHKEKQDHSKKEKQSEQQKEEKEQIEEKKDDKRIKSQDSHNDKVLASPVVRAFAKDHKIDINLVKGSGPKGRVLKEDILNFKNKSEKRIEKVELPKQNVQEMSMNMFQQGMVKSMTQSLSVPHFNLHDEYKISDLLKMRKQFIEITGQKVSIFALVIKCFSQAIKENPKINSTYYPDNDQFKYYINQNHNISIAVNSKNGLAAPNIKDVQNKSVIEIEQEVKKIIKLADEGRLSKEYLEGGTCALSNIGTISGYFAAPLNLPNQTCIVALGKSFKKPVWNSQTEKFDPEDVLPVSFGCDHRILDGGTVANFSLSWKKYMENPSLLLCELK